MAKQHILPLLVTIISLFILAAATAAPTNFIKSSCKATSYPLVCVRSLSAYAGVIRGDPCQLAHAALTVSLSRAQSTHSFTKKLAKFRGLKSREYGAIRDCLEEIGDSVERISKSIKELKFMGRSKKKGADFFWHMSNVRTWVSAALTDENTCLDGFSGKALDGRVKASVKDRVTHVAQVTSNALALVNQYASKY